MPYTPSGPLSVVGSYGQHPPYFKSLVDFEVYMENLPKPIPPPAAPLRPRRPQAIRHGDLYVCHDMAGGYPDDAHNPMWTMQWWAIANTFIYFSHHRVSPPPREWINAGHRQGCKVLGTLILEDAGDRYRILTGKDTPVITPEINTISEKYADLLIDLCELRDFDGYLLNFEIAYENVKNARLLGAWVAYLTSESRRRLGAERSVIMWYDSVNVNGQLWWQNTLNQRNSAFFIASDSFFTNYNYSNTTIPAAEKFLQNLVGDTRPNADISWGIDMWGRGTYQGGGYRACLALDTIEPGNPPAQHGFSASLFAPAYLWENGDFQPHDRPSWWARDSLLWVGRSTKEKTLQDLERLNTDPNKQLRPTDIYRPLKEYFRFQPQSLPFTTNFSLGAGTFFNIEGAQVQPGLTWSDHEWVAPLPDLAMPCSWATGSKDETLLVECDWVAEPEKVWTGGHSIQLSCPTYEKELGLLHTPLVTLDLGPGPEYDCVIMCELVWRPSNARSNAGVRKLSMVQTAKRGQRIDPDYKVNVDKASEYGWFKTTAFFDRLEGVVEVAAVVDFDNHDNAAVIVGSINIKAVSGTSDGTTFTPYITYIDAANLQAHFVNVPDGFTATLTWEPRIRPPVDDGSASLNPAWPTICRTTLNKDDITYEITTYLVASAQGKRVSVAWGTTSMRRHTLTATWSSGELKAAMAKAGVVDGFLLFKVQALNGSGSYAGAAAEMSVSFGQGRIL